jgi:hypothetical protein
MYVCLKQDASRSMTMLMRILKMYLNVLYCELTKWKPFTHHRRYLQAMVITKNMAKICIIRPYCVSNAIEI